MTLEEEIKHCEEVADGFDETAQEIAMQDENGVYQPQVSWYQDRALSQRQIAEWLSELQRWREFGDWVVKAVLDDDWEDNADFYAEVLCRKLTKLGKLTLKDHKYMEVNSDEDR